LTEISRLLRQDAQPALDNEYALSTSVLQARGAAVLRDLDGFETSIENADRSVERVVSGLARITAATDASLRADLDKVIGDTSPLSGVTAGVADLQAEVQSFRNQGAEQANAYPELRQSANELRKRISAADEWIREVEGRISASYTPSLAQALASSPNPATRQ
jgi:chromosome segregation ATPase